MNLMTLTCICADRYQNKLGAETAILPGGESLNFASNCCQYKDLSVYLLGAVGTDPYGKSILTYLSGKNINTEHLYVMPGTTANNITYLTDEGDRYYKPDSWTGGVYETFKLQPADFSLLKKADIIHTSVNCPVFSDILSFKQHHDVCLAVDFNNHRDFDDWEKILPLIDIFFISGDSKTEEKLFQWSFQFSCIFIATLAEHGSAAFQKGTRYFLPAYKVSKIVDTTGCGDSYQAGFLADWCHKHTILSAMEEGTRLASETLTHLGGVYFFMSPGTSTI